MKKTVLKKSEILESLRPIVIKKIEEEEEATFTPFSSFGGVPSLMNEVPSEVPEPTFSQEPEDKSYDSLISENMLNHIEADPLNTLPPITSEPEAIIHVQEDLAPDHSHSPFAQDNEKLEKEHQDLLDQIEAAKKELESVKNDIESSQQEAQNIIQKANQEQENIAKAAQDQGKQEGLEQGMAQGQDEVHRLVELLQKISSKIIDEKNTILTNIEADLVDLSLMIAGKVVKSVTETYKRVVYDNVVAAIAKLKVKSDLIIKVNPEDLPTMEKYKDNLIKEVQGLENLQMIEDPTVDKGGCIIISDFGSVDARIASQLAEIEEQVRKVSPIKDL